MFDSASRRFHRLVTAAPMALLLVARGAHADEAPEEPVTTTVGAATVVVEPSTTALRVFALDAPEGPVDCIEARPLDPQWGSIAGTSFARICTYAAPPLVANPGALEPSALTLATLIEHVRAALPDASEPAAASFPFAGEQVDGLRLTLALGDASAEVTAAAVAEGDAVVVLWYQRTDEDSAYFSALNTFVDGARLGAADADSN